MTGRPGKAMSEAALAPSTLQRGCLASARGRRYRLNAVEAVGRGFALVRSTFAWEAWRYYSGAAPMVLCFIPMWVVNGQIRLSDGALLVEAALLTGAYLVRAWSVSSYMQRVRERAFGVPRPAPEGASAKLAAMGRLLAWKIVLSAAALVALTTVAGASWCYSACQFASLEAREDGSKRHSISGCLPLARQLFGGGVGCLARSPTAKDKKKERLAPPPTGGARGPWGVVVLLAAIEAAPPTRESARPAVPSQPQNSRGPPADTAREAQIQKLRRALD